MRSVMSTLWAAVPSVRWPWCAFRRSKISRFSDRFSPAASQRWLKPDAPSSAVTVSVTKKFSSVMRSPVPFIPTDSGKMAERKPTTFRSHQGFRYRCYLHSDQTGQSGTHVDLSGYPVHDHSQQAFGGSCRRIGLRRAWGDGHNPASAWPVTPGKSPWPATSACGSTPPDTNAPGAVESARLGCCRRLESQFAISVDAWWSSGRGVDEITKSCFSIRKPQEVYCFRCRRGRRIGFLSAFQTRGGEAMLVGEVLPRNDPLIMIV